MSLLRNRSILTPLALVALGTTALAVVGSGAVFTDSQAIGGNSFTTGSVDLSAEPTTAAVTLSNMAPGDVQVGAITVDNPGSLAYRYALSSTTASTDAKGLAGQLVLTVKTGVTACTATGFVTDGTVVSGEGGPFGSAAGAAVFGSSATGAQAGDRTLAATTSETLCVSVALPLGTGNDFQTANASATFTFDAEQTKNN